MAYIIDQLAQRWHCTPWEIEEAPYAWREAGLAFMSIEAQTQQWRADHRGGNG